MTIITVRGGVMAVDSRVSSGGSIVGNVAKWAAVSEKHGGGFVAFSGDLQTAQRVLSAYALDGESTSEDNYGIHLRADGSVLLTDGKHWYQFSASFYAVGSRESQALAAMHAGASAKNAAQIICHMFPSECGGEVHALEI